MNWASRSVGVGAIVLVCLASVPALAVDEDVETFARVVVGETELRSGPGVAHRVVHIAERGETFAVQGRAATGFWFRVYLSDGRTAYVLGDVVETVAVGEDAENAPSAPGFFVAPNLASASGGVAMMGGLTGGIGYAEIRPALVLAPAIAIEPYAGLALTRAGRRFMYGGGLTLNLAPDWAIAPYVHLGGGGLTRHRREDQAADSENESVFHARAGGGLLISLRWGVLLRMEATNTILFTADSYDRQLTAIGGLGSYF